MPKSVQEEKKKEWADIFWHLPSSTCGGAVLFPPGIGSGVAAALFPCPHGVLTWPGDQRGGRDGTLQLRGRGEVVARARAHRLLYAA